ncbi:MAG: amino acid adenylation domain-containing protein, partial [Acutalibacteraceae bacterium]
STFIAPVENDVLHRIFEKQAKNTPDRKAVVACDRTLTYSELNRLSNITANELIARGFKKGGKAVILLSRTSKIFTSIFGILKAGGAFIPTCPDYPRERIESIIEDSEADFVITEGKLLDVYNKTVNVDELLAGSNSDDPNIDVSGNDLAYLIYTSGSTGKPKGVMLCHKGISNYITYSEANTHVRTIVDNGTAYGSVTTVAFDMSLKETVMSLCNGLTLVFANEEQTMEPSSLAKCLTENNVDVFNSTPSRLLLYMELEEFAKAMANCKVILSGGEKYPDKLLKLLQERTNAKILNTYGPTEITVSSNCKDLTEACGISIGKPLMNYIEHIVDSDGNLLPVGVVGELLISGCGVALGYNRLPEQTKKAFIEYNGERTYCSGDYAKWTKNGDVIILGRTDNQVKLRGLRIELGEIEKRISNISGIKSVIVLIRKVNKTDAICAYYTADSQLDCDDIRNELKKSLTEYMIPTAFVQLDSMPLTPNGKINTKLLPEPSAPDTKEGLEPSTLLEKKLCEIYEKVLDLDKVYADGNFFDLGGSSLTVTRVVILANKANIDISYGDVFANPTPASLAKLLDKNTEKEDPEDLSNFDYGNINKLLMNNRLDSIKNGEMQEIGDVLLTGAAGFLGIHILYELIHRYTGKIYCMLRDKKNTSAEKHLNTIFFYYFEESLKEKYADRVIVLNGDVTDLRSFDKFLQYKIDTVINCAANVKHFSKGTDIEDVNLYGLLNVIDFCKQADARLIHVSTMSIGGVYIGTPGEVTSLEETDLYFGQQQISKYTMSKFLAERAILDEAAKGFNAKIMRVGNLSARNSDGMYQINFTTNTFMGRLKSNLIIGKYPYDMIEKPFELSPIDSVAEAILLLAQTPKECTVFHPFNNHTLMMGDLYLEMDRNGLHSEAAETDEFEKALETAQQDPEKAKILSSMIAYQNLAHGQQVYTVEKNNKYTMQVLYRMGFRWPETSHDYMKRFIKVLKDLGFFDFN